MVLLATLFLVIVMAQSCYYDNEEELYPFDVDCNLPPAVTYAGQIEAIIQGNCAVPGCHTGNSPTGGLFLDTYQQVKAVADNGKLTNRTIVQETMPPSSPLSNCDQEAIQVWVNNGAPEN